MPTAQKVTSTKSKHVNGASPAITDNITEQMDALKKDIATLTDRLSKLGETGMQTALATGERARIEGQEKAQDALDTAYLQILELEQKASKTVREKPVQTLGIAVGLGFLAALLMRR